MRPCRSVTPRTPRWTIVGVIAAGDEALMALVLRQLRRLHGFLVVLLLLHLRLRDEEGIAGAPVLLPTYVVATVPCIDGRRRKLRLVLNLTLGTM